jgi:hypothetical protein
VRGEDIGKYAGDVLTKVRTKWNRLLADDEPDSLANATAIVEVRITPEGSTQNLRVTDSAGDQSLYARHGRRSLPPNRLDTSLTRSTKAIST